MAEIEDRYRFTFHVDADGNLTKVPPLPWRVGSPGNTVEIQLINEHGGFQHRVRMIRWKHSGTAKALDPLTGTKQWQSFGGAPANPSRHKVRNHPDKYYEYAFRTEFDGNEGEDPEIIVDPPPDRPKSKPAGKPSPVGRATRKAAKKGSGKTGKADKGGKAKSKKAKKGKAGTAGKTRAARTKKKAARRPRR